MTRHTQKGGRGDKPWHSHIQVFFLTCLHGPGNFKAHPKHNTYNTQHALHTGIPNNVECEKQRAK
eukprot:3215198-Rhodomonas_salina.1